MVFISGVSIALARNKNNHPTNPYFREAWVFSAAMAIVDACANASSVSSTSTTHNNIARTPPKPPAPPPPLQRFLSVRSTPSNSSNSNLNTEKSVAPTQIAGVAPSTARATSTLSLTAIDTNVSSTKVYNLTFWWVFFLILYY